MEGAGGGGGWRWRGAGGGGGPTSKKNLLEDNINEELYATSFHYDLVPLS